MKLSKMVLLILLVGILPGLVFAGGGNQGGTQGSGEVTIVNGREMVNNTFITGLPIVNQPTTLRIAFETHFQDELAGNNFDRKPFVLIAERATGLKIEWSTPATTAVPAILASGDLPDAFIGLITDQLLVQNSNLFLPLEDKLERWAPNVLSFYEEHVPDWKRFLTLDGHIYSMMNNFHNSLPHKVDSLTYVNTNWLRAIGRQIPGTVNEFRDVLRAFKTQNVGNPGGQNNKIPLNFCNPLWNGGIQFLAGPWGIQGNYNLINGRILPTVNSANYREYLEFVHGLVSEGLVNVEGFSQNREQYAAQQTEMRVGVFLGWAPTVFIPNPADHPMWEVVPPLAVPGKENLRIFYGASKARSQSGRHGFHITKQSKHPEAAMRWWDYISRDQDAAMLSVHGEPGVGYYKRGNEFIQVQPTDEQARQYGLVTANDFFPSIGMVNFHPVVLNYPATDLERSPYTENAWRQRAIPKYWNYLPDEVLPRALASPAKVEERALLELDLLPFINSFRADAILNGLTDAKWNTYVNELQNRYRYNDWLKWHQDFVDGRF